jgi:hypothetical protein
MNANDDEYREDDPLAGDRERGIVLLGDRGARRSLPPKAPGLRSLRAAASRPDALREGPQRRKCAA